jgi:cytochrome c oxidase subunit I+III
MTFTLAADAVLFSSLLFGGLFLWLVAPAWPPPAISVPDLATVAVAALALAVAAVAGRLAVSRLTRDASPVPWLVVTALAQAVAVAALVLLATAVPEPTGHAHRAVIFLVFAYAGLHAAVGLILALHGIARSLTGRLSAARSVDLRIGMLWHGYTAVAGVVALGAAVGLALLAGVEPGR